MVDNPAEFVNGTLEVDPNATSADIADFIEVDDDDENDNAASLYAISTYPRVPSEYLVEEPFECAVDGSSVIDSSRTIYADDVDYVVENGRQYCGDYFMPIDQAEQTRQYVMHQVFLKLFDLELTTVPLENPEYILDVGTGIGEWAIGMAEKYPDCEVFGTDIAPIQPTQVPANIEFHIENGEEEWIRPADAVDLVHFRNMAGAFSDWPFIYQQAFHCIKPGGWIELLDYDDFMGDRNFLSLYPPDSYAYILTKGLIDAAGRAGKPMNVAHLDKSMLSAAGFVDVQERVYDLGIGDNASRSYGKFWLFAIVTGFESVSMRLLSKYLDWDPDYIRELCDKVALETRELAEDAEKSAQFVVKVRVVSARKPMMAGQWTAQALNENGHMDYQSADESTIGGRTIRRSGSG